MPSDSAAARKARSAGARSAAVRRPEDRHWTAGAGERAGDGVALCPLKVREEIGEAPAGVAGCSPGVVVAGGARNQTQPLTVVVPPTMRERGREKAASGARPAGL